MITRLKIKGFKNIYKAEIFFGPFTCIAGANGVGKSNLFDAIRFLSAAASNENTLTDAAYQVRDEKKKNKIPKDIKNLFYQRGDDFEPRIEFDADILIPKTGFDHLGQMAEATITSLNYQLCLAFKKDSNGQEGFEIIWENLFPITKSDAKRKLSQFGASSEWINSVLSGKTRSTPFIDTDVEKKLVAISADKGGRRKTLKIDQLPRTVLSTATAIENPTMLLVKNELESWKILQFEPSALRSPDDLTFLQKPTVSSSGEHLPATLYKLLANKNLVGDVAVKIANKLKELVQEVDKISVDKDEKRDLLTLLVENSNGTVLSARSLSDGTLRFIALAIIEADPDMQGVFCFEEPENGIHPEKMGAIVRLIQDIATDSFFPVDNENPLRQIIINTHSPIVVSEMPDGSLLYAEQVFIENKKTVVFQPLSSTWRTSFQKDIGKISKNRLLAFLNPYQFEQSHYNEADKAKIRIIDRPEFKQLSLFSKHD